MSDSNVFSIKAGDTRPPARLQLTRDEGAGQVVVSDDLTGATVQWRFRNKLTPTTLYGPFTGDVESNDDKIVRRQWASGDWSSITADTEVEFEVEITYSSGAIETFPTRGFFKGMIYADID